MKKRMAAVLLCVSMVLTGCGWSGKRYVSVTPHLEQRQETQSEAAFAADSLDLILVLEEMIQSCTESGVIYIPEYPAEYVDNGMDAAVGYVMGTYPLGAYAVEEIRYEVGTTGGLPAMAVTIVYRHSDAEIRQIRDIERMDDAQPLVAEALEGYDARLVLRTGMYFETDFQQMARSYAEAYPELVMEVPQVTVSVYGVGTGRVVELSFAYETSRDSLRQMQAQVMPVFEAAELYVSGDGAQRQKYLQLYAFLMERFDYQVETSITPAYSLLRHGVGDSRAFATVYAAMCRRADLECMVVTGTRSGEPWVWNMVKIGEGYQHLDLLRCNDQGQFQGRCDWEMDGYVWDYSAYPACLPVQTQEPSQPAQSQTVAPEQTEPVETAPETEPEEQPEETAETTLPAETEPSETTEEKIEEK